MLLEKKKRVLRFDIRRTVKNLFLFENNLVDIYRKVKCFLFHLIVVF